MLRYILARLLQMIVTLLAISIVVFIVLRAVPGDLATVYLGMNANPASLAEFRHEFGLDRPLYVQYLDWLGGAVRGEFGDSFASVSQAGAHSTGAVNIGFSVGDQIRQRVPVTAELTLLAVLVSVLVGIPAGTVAAYWRNSPIDYVVSTLGLFGLSTPSFWLATILILVLSVGPGLLPAAGFVLLTDDPLGNLRLMLMPALSLGLVSASVTMRMTRSAMVEVLAEDYIRTARAKGLHGRAVLAQHALKNALIPVVTVVGMDVGYIFSGAVLIEIIFLLPGLGTYALLGIQNRDYPTLQAAVFVMAAIFMLSNLVVDVLYAVLNPRIREARR